MSLEKADIEFYFNQIDNKLDGINSRLDTLNSKTQSNSIDIAVIKALQAQSETLAAKTGRNHGALWGSLGGLALLIASYLYQWIFHVPPPSVNP